MRMFVALILCGCSHEATLVTVEKSAWINIESAADERVYYCVADVPEKPTCYAPQLVFPSINSKMDPTR